MSDKERIYNEHGDFKGYLLKDSDGGDYDSGGPITEFFVFAVVPPLVFLVAWVICSLFISLVVYMTGIGEEYFMSNIMSDIMLLFAARVVYVIGAISIASNVIYNLIWPSFRIEWWPRISFMIWWFIIQVRFEVF